MSNYNPLEDDDIVIEPDTAPAQPQQQQPQQHTASTNTNSTSAQPKSFLTSFINPQNYINPLLESNNVEVREHQFTGGNTLDEPVLTTLKRDLASIADKTLSILWPMRLRQKLKIVERMTGMGQTDEAAVGGSADASDYSKETLKKILDWDLWGPLVINLGFSLVITALQTRNLEDTSSSQIFSGAFTLIWAALAVLSINIQLVSPVKQRTEEGGTTAGVMGLSFFQCISILSYTLFPIAIGGLICVFVHLRLVRMAINLVTLAWSLLCSWLILAIINNCKTPAATPGMIYDSVMDANNSSEAERRIFLMVYPIFLVFGLFGWLCVIV